MKRLFVYAIPGFIAFILWEYAAIQKHKRDGGPRAQLIKGYKLKDALACIAMGFGNLGVGVLAAGFQLAAMVYCYEHRVYTMPKTVAAFALLVLLEDLSYYWFHRVSHECRLFWAAHETHHSSEYYNLATAVRQTWTGWPHTWIFWVWLPFVGFPVEWVLAQQAVSLFYQFFIHTEIVGKLGALEWVMNTPSHHRVHHATDVPYLDKNYAGIFIVWDRLFGTFEEEQATPVYGVLKPPGSDNPFVIGFHAWIDIAKDVARAPSWTARFLYVFGRPGWGPNGTSMTVPIMQRKWREERGESVQVPRVIVAESEG